jgi:hypothetical protein
MATLQAILGMKKGNKTDGTNGIKMKKYLWKDDNE